MIGLILGTSEGRKILSLLNEFTEDICVSTATSYGGELLKEYKYKSMNTKPLDKEGLKAWIRDKGISLLVDASHPYALEVSKNAFEACKEMETEYLRYERPSVMEKYKQEKLVIELKDYEELKEYLSGIKGNILNTTGSRNMLKLINLGIKNRMIHRVLPTLKVMQECEEAGIKVEDIIAIKGPVGYELNCAFIKDYEAKAIIMKDSGVQGGTEEKLRAAIDMNIPAYVIGRRSSLDINKYSSEEAVAEYIKVKFNINKHV